MIPFKSPNLYMRLQQSQHILSLALFGGFGLMLAFVGHSVIFS